MGSIGEWRGTELYNRVFNFPNFIVCIQGYSKMLANSIFTVFHFFCFCSFISIAFENNPRHFILSFNGIICGPRSFTVHAGDHLQSQDHLWSCTVQQKAHSWGGVGGVGGGGQILLLLGKRWKTIGVASIIWYWLLFKLEIKLLLLNLKVNTNNDSLFSRKNFVEPSMIMKSRESNPWHSQY